LLVRLGSNGRGRIEHIAALNHHLRSAALVNPKDVPRNVITMNSRVVLRDLDSRKRLHCTLADPHDVSLFGDRLSVAAPPGIALLGKHVGQIVQWTLGNKVRRLRVERILYQPEAAGDFHL
jgi:regulator of nucleoside diphosphate kinase